MLYKHLKLSECNLNLTSQIVGVPLKIDNSSDYTVDDHIFNHVLQVNNMNYESFSNQYRKIFKTLNISNLSDLDLLVLLGKSKVSRKVAEFQKITSASLTDYYFKVLRERYKFTGVIGDASYDHISSITGRMVIKEGVNYLTMKKDNRHKIEKAPNTKLVEIDVKSCEPALLHAVIYNETPADIYKIFSEPGIPRAKVKIAVISSLYGSSSARVQKISGLSYETIKKIHSHFQLEERIKLLKKEYSKKGYFLNMYGRPIYEISSPVNYWLQSTAADFCCLAFKSLVTKEKFNLKAVIHDAIIVEVEDCRYEELKRIETIKDPISGITLRVDNTLIA